MKRKALFCTAAAGALAGLVNGLFGAGGGMVLVPLLTLLTNLEEDEIFPASVTIIFPICIISLLLQFGIAGLPLREGWPYFLGSIPGGLLAHFYGHKIPVKWLHRLLGLLILYGGIKYLC